MANAENFVCVPATPLLPADESRNQKWLLTLTGVVDRGWQGQPITSTGSVLNGWQDINDNLLPDVISPLNFALRLYGVPLGPEGTSPFFNLDPDFAPCIAISGAFDQVPDAPYFPSSGFLLDPAALGQQLGEFVDYQGNVFSRVFIGWSITLHARNCTTINKICYNITLLGEVFFRYPQI